MAPSTMTRRMMLLFMVYVERLSGWDGFFPAKVVHNKKAKPTGRRVLLFIMHYSVSGVSEERKCRVNGLHKLHTHKEKTYASSGTTSKATSC
jgi:hypothetical protein